MKIGVAITMHSEHNVVIASIINMKRRETDQYTIALIHSDDGSDTSELEKLVDHYERLPDLFPLYNRFNFGAHAQSRNYNAAFRWLYYTNIEFDILVAMFGDTLITDPSNFNRRYDEMKLNGKIAMVSQAIGHWFYSNTDDPTIIGQHGSRYQDEKITDIMPQLFLLDGKFARANKLFADIKVTNQFTTEQCMGDELARTVGIDFHDKIGRLNKDHPVEAYQYGDGVVLQYK